MQQDGGISLHWPRHINMSCLLVSVGLFAMFHLGSFLYDVNSSFLINQSHDGKQAQRRKKLKHTLVNWCWQWVLEGYLLWIKYSCDWETRPPESKQTRIMEQGMTHSLFMMELLRYIYFSIYSFIIFYLLSDLVL